jgi:hypothetical protein
MKDASEEVYVLNAEPWASPIRSPSKTRTRITPE